VAYGDVIPADKIPADPIKNMDERYTYVFVGWYNGDELWNFETSVVTGETYLVSKYEQFDRLYKVTFDGENEQQLTYGAKIEAPADPIKEGYIFDGWYMGATKWNFDKDTLARPKGHSPPTSQRKVSIRALSSSFCFTHESRTDSKLYRIYAHI
jgi:hypothetical protein